MNIQLHIERVILDGLTIESSQRAVVQAALEAELVRLLESGGLAAPLIHGGATPVLRAGEMQLTSPAAPAQLGGQIAGAVYRGIGQTGGAKQ